MSLAGVLSPFPLAGAVEHAYEQLVVAILNGDLPTGQRLTEDTLAQSLHVSRPTVREALRMVAQFGMVERRRGRNGGWYVIRRQPHRLSNALTLMVLGAQISFKEIFEARHILEMTAVDLAARLQRPDDIALMDSAIVMGEADPGDLERFEQSNALFHSALAHASGNSVLTIMSNSIQPLIIESLHGAVLDFAAVERANQEHRRILAAIEQGDGESARSALSDHLISFEKRIEHEKGALEKITISATSGRLQEWSSVMESRRDGKEQVNDSA